MKYFKSNKYGKLLKIGNMIPTNTIITTDYMASTEFEIIGKLKTDTEKITWEIPLSKSSMVYGLGESNRGMNKRGYIYKSFCTDDPSHTPDKESLYGAHNFFMILDERTFGVYLDFASKITYDIDFGKPGTMIVDVDGLDVDLYIFEGEPKEIVRKFRELIGMSYMPPKWGFGYQQSRWSYENAEVVRGVIDNFDAHDIPLDAVYLDIDYMERFKDFTVDDKVFPKFEALVEEVIKKKVHLVPIIDAGIKIEKGYDVYDEGVKNNYFTVDRDGKPFVAAVWPGKVHFPDFFNPDVRVWFGDKYHELMKLGVDGFWNDMNEPAIFYSEKGLSEAIDFVSNQQGKNLDIHTFFNLKDKILNISNSEKDYKSMYHKYFGRMVNHFDVHNLYGYYMTQAAAEGFRRFDPNKRFLMITRASHIGMAKYSGIWTGDNHSWWEHLKLNIQMMPGLNMAGFIYSGADTGGFGGNVSADLLVRWHQFSMFTPLFRNHSAMGTRRQEPWAFDEETLSRLRNMIRLRYAMIPFIYSETMKSVLESKLLFAPLSFEYLDKGSLHVEDQLLFGDSIMLTPIYEQNSIGRSVYCPEDMVLWKAKAFDQIEPNQFELLDKGHHHISVDMDEVPIFIRKDKMMLLTEPENRVQDISLNDIRIIAYVNSEATYSLYDDDGLTKHYATNDNLNTTFRVIKIDNEYKVFVDTNDLTVGNVKFYIIDTTGELTIIDQPMVHSNREIV